MPPSTSVVSATSDVLFTAAQTATQAFADSPWVTWAVPAEDREIRLLDLFEIRLSHAHAYGRVLTTTDGTGVIALVPADAPAPAPRTLHRIASLHGDRAELVNRHTPVQQPRDTWRIDLLGVHPEHMRLGIASSLLVHALTETNELGATVTLETADERNLRLFERYGFSVTNEIVIDGGPEVWTMERRR